MTAVAGHLSAQQDRSDAGPGRVGTGPALVPGPALPAAGPGMVRDQTRTIRSWPLLLLAFPAAAEVWSGWVGIAQKTGFGRVSPLPGIWPSLHLDTTITLPIGVEAYAAYALRAWLAADPWISPQTRRFAKWSAICSFALGMGGQVAYHLLTQAGEARAPWYITTVVSCLPVLVLAMGTALAHMLRDDASARDTPDARPAGPGGERSPRRSASDQPEDQDQPDQDQPDHDQPADRDRPDQDWPGLRTGTPGRSSPTARTGEPAIPAGPTGPLRPAEDLSPGPAGQDDAEALRIARELVAAGRSVSRRALRNGGVRGSNESLNTLARLLSAEVAKEQAIAA